MLDLTQGGRHDPERRRHAHDRRLHEDPADGRRHQGGAEGNGVKAARAAAPPRHALRRARPRRRELERCGPDHRDGGASDPDRATGGAHAQGHAAVPPARAGEGHLVSSIITPKLARIPLASWERGGVIAALKRVGLPADDVEEPDRLFWRFEVGDMVPVGFGGLEIHRPDALLRSIVTLPMLRGRGFGHSIVGELEAEARIAGCTTAWLLTSSPDYFVQL